MAPTIDDTARSKVLELLALPSPDSMRPTAIRREHLRRDEGVQYDRVVLDAADGDTIPCLLLTPDEQAGIDVIAVHQHAGAFAIGKSEPAGLIGEPTLAYGTSLARAGARVILPDLVGFEERQRRWTDDPAADERLDALFRVAKGSSLQSKHTGDIAVVTSWMQDTSVGPTDVRIIGHSLGGQVALFSLAVDARVSKGVVSCGIGSLASFESERIRHNPAWFVPGLLASGDVPLVAAAVEQPVLVAAGRNDKLFPMAGVQDAFDAFRPGVLTAIVFDGGHSMPPFVLDAAVQHLLASPAMN
ncbi:alpha/beta fold hydrolase [Curtobacterium sp. MCBD17_003]|uniref:alpha/beta hydrolase family protein n=1 Tax=Curtobacterium sp. MCBD17_003 TaxID=2175667 RepID=UPI000DA8CF4C|nr:alpha/beta fold hydrolase [Curtobacterium sp. MCBD17_003]WIE55663.1 dienelactone hydrolase family protein [Curtobacterium sp. MCBD17_003]